MADQEKKPRATIPLHTVRTKDGGTRTMPMGRKLAMAAMCTECLGWSHPSGCTSPMCPLFPYRAKTEQTLVGDL